MNLLSIAIVNNNALKSNNIGTSINPQIAASGNNVYVT
jgi:hypothetical protein